MDINHADLIQVQRAIGGKYDGCLVAIEDDVLDVARRLKEIHPSLHVYFNEVGGYFVIYEMCEDGTERLVTTVKELDGKLIKYFEMLNSESWDAVAEMERMDETAERNRKAAFAERVGEIGERLHHALRKDYEVKDRITLPRGI